ncbi:MAG: ATP-binding protein, partial [Acidimicrobiia bacterium]
MVAASSGTVTLLFTDLVGSTEGRGRLGEEAAEALRRTHDRLVATAIESQGGQVVKHLGDGVMATFAGAADGLSAAVAVQRAVARHNRSAEGAERLEVRAGLSAGDVTFEDGDVFGTPVIEAARLCAAARGAQILAADVVRVLAGSRGGHRFVPAGALELKGLPGPVTAVEVAWEAEPGSALPLPVALSRPGSFRFVGREGEVNILTRGWKAAAAGERRVVLVAGDAGVGKTRLVAEAVRRFHAKGSVVLFGRCEEELGIPYQPFAEALSDYVAAVPRDELRSQLGSLGGELARLAPRLPERVTGLAEPLRAEPETERYRLFEAVRELLTAISDAAPVVLVLDDLQWAARPTLALLVHLVRRAGEARLLVVATYRDTDLGRNDPLADVLADLRRSTGTERLSLAGLDEDGAVTFVEALTGHALEGDMLALTRAAWAETEGNPFFLGEVMRHFVETGVAAEVDGRWRVVRPLEHLGIPEGVREVVGRRLSRLSEAANEVLAVAAVIGREFDMGLLTEVVGGGADAVLDAIEEAEAARLVVADRGRPGVYSFAHALVRSTLYEELPSAGRLRLHRRVGLALEQRVGAALPELARHFVEAAPLGESTRAVEYARQAGDRARDGLAMDEAATHYERALNALDFSDGADPAVRCDLLIALGDALYRARDRRYRKILAAAAEAARGLGDARRLGRVVIVHNPKFARPVGTMDEGVIALAEEALAALPPDDDPLRARLIAVLALELAWSPDADRRRSLLEEAKAMAQRLGDRRVLADVLIFRRWADTDPQDLPARLAGATELVALGEELGDVEATCIGEVWLGMCHYEDLDTSALISGIESAAALVGQLRQPLLATE